MVTTIRLPEELHRGLKAKAKSRGMSFNGYLLEILWDRQKQEMNIGICEDSNCTLDHRFSTERGE